MRKKTERGDSLVSPGMVCYAEKEEKPFWFSSLGQMIQFGTIKFCRTILVSSCGLKKVTIIVALHFMKKQRSAILPLNTWIKAKLDLDLVNIVRNSSNFTILQAKSRCFLSSFLGSTVSL